MNTDGLRLTPEPARCIASTTKPGTLSPLTRGILGVSVRTSSFIGLHLWFLFALAGCENMNPLSREDYTIELSTADRLRAIGAMDPAAHAVTPPETIEEGAARLMRDLGTPPIAEGAAEAPLTLADVRAAALANNLDLQVALYNPSISEEAIDIEEARFEWLFTASARRFSTDSPTDSELDSAQATFDQFDLGVNVPLRTGGTASVNLPMSRSETNNQFATLNPSFETDLQFSLSHPLLRNAGVRVNTHGIRVAKYQSRLVESQTKLEAIRILAAADRAYWGLYAARRALDVAQQQYELAMAQLQRAQRRLNAGEGLELDVTRAESGVAQRLEGIFIARHDILQRQRDLKRLMNRDDLAIDSAAAVIPATDPNPLGLDLDAAALAGFAIENRMEMLEEELRLAIAASTIDFERNQSLPLVTLDYTYNVNGLGGNFGNAFDMLAQKSFEDWSLGLSAEIPIGNEAAKSRVHRAVLERLQRLSSKDLREQAIRQEVLDVVDRLETDWQRILAARQSVILATRVLQGEERQFNLNVRTSTDVLDAAAALADAQLAEIRALVDYQISQVDLCFATGTLLGAGQVRWEPITAAEAEVDVFEGAVEVFGGAGTDEGADG
jgi:outer membrane protein